MVIFKGKKKGNTHTIDIELSDIIAVFFPKDFYEKYKYLGSVPWKSSGQYFNAIYPLVLAMDYEAKPKWCPRWFLRFTHLFGNDNSIVRVRNRKIANLHRKLTKGILMWDWKTKWTDYDLRISISAPEHLQNLSSAIEHDFYDRGKQEDLIKQILELDPNASIIRGGVSYLSEKLDKLLGIDENEKI